MKYKTKLAIKKLIKHRSRKGNDDRPVLQIRDAIKGTAIKQLPSVASKK